MGIECPSPLVDSCGKAILDEYLSDFIRLDKGKEKKKEVDKSCPYAVRAETSTSTPPSNKVHHSFPS